jgi:ribose transport system permease protein
MKRRVPQETGILVVLLLVGVVFTRLSPYFLTESNLFTLLLNTAVVALLALGQTFVLLTAGIDLSVGSGIALSGVTAAIVLAANGSVWEAVVAGVLATAAIGLINGVIIHYLKVPAFITTFGTMSVAASIPMIVTQAVPIAITNQSFANLGGGFLGPVPVPVAILFVVAILAYFILARTVFGIHVYAVGGNRESARLAGVNTARVDIIVYLVSGILSGVSGIIDASRLMAGYPTAGSGTDLFFSIAAAVVGGVSLFGGVGTIPGVIVGAVLIGTISDGLNIANVSSYWQPLVIGLIILIGVTFDTLRQSRTGNLSLLQRVAGRLWMRAPSASHGPDEASRA